MIKHLIRVCVFVSYETKIITKSCDNFSYIHTYDGTLNDKTKRKKIEQHKSLKINFSIRFFI